MYLSFSSSLALTQIITEAPIRYGNNILFTYFPIFHYNQQTKKIILEEQDIFNNSVLCMVKFYKLSKNFTLQNLFLENKYKTFIFFLTINNSIFHEFKDGRDIASIRLFIDKT